MCFCSFFRYKQSKTEKKIAKNQPQNFSHFCHENSNETFLAIFKHFGIIINLYTLLMLMLLVKKKEKEV